MEDDVEEDGGGGRSSFGGRDGGRGGGGGRGSGSPHKRQRELKDDELGEGHDGFAVDDAFDQSKVANLRNEKFESYYQTQGIVADEEWQTMLQSFQTPLPLTFRVNMSGKFRESTKRKLVDELFPQVTRDNVHMRPPKCLKWYPDSLAWQIDIPKDALKGSEGLQTLRNFIVRANEVGAITRQEAVSMIPPLLLDVEPEHRVLDMCAAPGSKTFQLLEMLHAKSNSSGSGSSSSVKNIPTGVVVANDASLQRANLLTHQTKRSNSPCLLVTNHQAQKFPFLRETQKSDDGQNNDTSDGKNNKNDTNNSVYRFDRILADVPCSGDGTLRKSPDLWKKWTPASGVDLHTLQLSIAEHAARLLKVGGRLVYSTCSLNPLENEAVVSALLKGSKGALKLVDVCKKLPGLERRPGMHNWRVGDVFGWHDDPSVSNQSRKQKGLADSMWPPSNSTAKEQKLERCVRIMPHLDDTGGFFIVAIEKIKEMPGDENGITISSEMEQKEAKNNRDGGWDGGDWHKSNRVAPVVAVESLEILESMSRQYGLDVKQSGLKHGLMTRAQGSGDKKNPKRLYYLSPGARALVMGGASGSDESSNSPDSSSSSGQLQIVAAGVKAFERQHALGSKCAYRLTQEGLDSLLPALQSQVVRASLAEIEYVLKRQQGEPQSAEAQRLDLLRDPDAPEGCWEKDTVRAMRKVTPGCVILVTQIRDEGEQGDDERKSKKQKKEKKGKKDKGDKDEKSAGWAGIATPNDLAVACWLGEGEKGKSLSVLATKAEGGHLLHQLKERAGCA